MRNFQPDFYLFTFIVGTMWSFFFLLFFQENLEENLYWTFFRIFGSNNDVTSGGGKSDVKVRGDKILFFFDDVISGQPLSSVGVSAVSLIGNASQIPSQ